MNKSYLLTHNDISGCISFCCGSDHLCLQQKYTYLYMSEKNIPDGQTSLQKGENNDKKIEENKIFSISTEGKKRGSENRSNIRGLDKYTENGQNVVLGTVLCFLRIHMFSISVEQHE